MDIHVSTHTYSQIHARVHTGAMMRQSVPCKQSLCMLTSGPLNTDGSFISFQTNRLGVEPS